MAARLRIAVLAFLAGVAVPQAAAAQADQLPPGWTPERPSIVNPPQNTALDGWEAYKGSTTPPSQDQHLDDPMLHGAIDLHAHYGPDSYNRQWDAFEIARMAQERGMRGIVIKNHWSESAALAAIVQEYATPDLEVWGGLALNSTVGGVNPMAVRYFAEVEGRRAKVVWMPTHDSEHEVMVTGAQRPFVRVSEGGELLPQVLEVLDLVRQYDLTLATGHVATPEMLAIMAEAQKRGITRIIVTHPGLGPMFTDPTLEDLGKAAAMGGTVEVVASELFGRLRPKMVEMIREIRPEHVAVSSDSGLVGTPNHTDALVMAARILREEGFTEDELTLMFKTNPARVLGLPVQGER